MKSRRIRLKTADDIKRIRESGRIISEILNRISNKNIVGISTWELDSYIDDCILKHKARPAFKTLENYNFASCISINNEVIHGVPKKKNIIKKGDIVKVDTGAVLNGYFSDCCRTFPAGSISDEANNIIKINKKALDLAIMLTVPGNRLGEIGEAIQRHTENNGFNIIKNFTGHGTGFSLHEPPVVLHHGEKGTGSVIREGLVIAIEPIINEGSGDVTMSENGWTVLTSDGKLSSQFEHTVAATSNGPLILTE